MHNEEKVASACPQIESNEPSRELEKLVVKHMAAEAPNAGGKQIANPEHVRNAKKKAGSSRITDSAKALMATLLTCGFFFLSRELETFWSPSSVPSRLAVCACGGSNLQRKLANKSCVARHSKTPPRRPPLLQNVTYSYTGRSKRPRQIHGFAFTPLYRRP